MVTAETPVEPTVIQVDADGRLVLTKELVSAAGLQSGDQVQATSAGPGLIHLHKVDAPESSPQEARKLGINGTKFGSITIEGEVFEHDVIIRHDGQVKKRKKKLSKAVYGTSHTISLDEAQYVYQEGAQQLIIGAGQYGMVQLSDEAAAFFQRKGCRVTLLPTPQAVQAWNAAEGDVIGLFHVTC